jgi:hypothetical protein
LLRLLTSVNLREEKRAALEQVRQMREWVIKAEHILEGSWASELSEVSNAEVGRRLDEWLFALSTFLGAEERTEEEQLRLGQLLKVRGHLRPGLVQWYDRAGFPRTNTELERTMRAIKMHSRRISGRKNWKSYLLRSGRCVASYEWWSHQPNGRPALEKRLQQVSANQWRCVRQETRNCHQEQLHRYQFRHRPLAYLASLEAQWEQASCCT